MTIAKIRRYSLIFLAISTEYALLEFSNLLALFIPFFTMSSTDVAFQESSSPDAETSSAIELSVLDPTDGEQAEREGREQAVIPRADGGRDAWLFLLGC